MKTIEKLGVSPAPWECIHNRDGGMDIIDGNSNVVAEILSDDAHDRSDGDMVAAAPDLYAALLRIVSDNKCRLKCGECAVTDPCDYHPAVKALVKAGGAK